MSKIKKHPMVLGFLRKIRSGPEDVVNAILVMADWLEENRQEDCASAIRLLVHKTMHGVETWKKTAIRGDKKRKYPVAEMIARWYADLISETLKATGGRRGWPKQWKDQIKIALPAAWKQVREWREEHERTKTENFHE